VTQWMTAAGLDLLSHSNLAPEPGTEGTMDGKIAVSLWLGRDRRIALAAPATREVA
jgi:hypothetical protein